MSRTTYGLVTDAECLMLLGEFGHGPPAPRAEAASYRKLQYHTGGSNSPTRGAFPKMRDYAEVVAVCLLCFVKALMV